MSKREGVFTAVDNPSALKEAVRALPPPPPPLCTLNGVVLHQSDLAASLAAQQARTSIRSVLSSRLGRKPDGNTDGALQQDQYELNHYNTRVEGDDLTVKLLVVGGKGSGKSTFVYRLCNNTKNPQSPVTINLNFSEKVLDMAVPVFLPSSSYDGAAFSSPRDVLNSTDEMINDPISGAPPPPFANPACRNALHPILKIMRKAKEETNNKRQAYRRTVAERKLTPLPMPTESVLWWPGCHGGGAGRALSVSSSEVRHTDQFVSIASLASSPPSVWSFANFSPFVTAALETPITVNPTRSNGLCVNLRERGLYQLVSVDGVARTEDAGEVYGSQCAVSEVYGIVYHPEPRTAVLKQRLEHLSTAGNTVMCEPARALHLVPFRRSGELQAGGYRFGYYENKKVKLHIWDIQGQDTIQVMTRQYYTDATCALVFVDLDRPSSLEEAIKWKADIDAKVVVTRAQPMLLRPGEGGMPALPPTKKVEVRRGEDPSTTRPARHMKAAKPTRAGSSQKGERSPSATRPSVVRGDSSLAPPRASEALSRHGSTSSFGSDSSPPSSPARDGPLPPNYHPQLPTPDAPIVTWLVFHKCDFLDKNDFPQEKRADWAGLLEGLVGDQYRPNNFPHILDGAGGAQRDPTTGELIDYFCQKYGFSGWSVASAKEGLNVQEVVEGAVFQACDRYTREGESFSRRTGSKSVRITKPTKDRQKKCC